MLNLSAFGQWNRPRGRSLVMYIMLGDFSHTLLMLLATLRMRLSHIGIPTSHVTIFKLIEAGICAIPTADVVALLAKRVYGLAVERRTNGNKNRGMHYISLHKRVVCVQSAAIPGLFRSGSVIRQTQFRLLLQRSHHRLQ